MTENQNIVIVWYENEPISLYLNDVLLWESKNIIVTELNPLQTNITLPVVEAIRFCKIFLCGLSSLSLINVLEMVKYTLQQIKDKGVENG